MNHFLSAEAAARYEKYRPKVHDLVGRWLDRVELPTRYTRALDLACGTGESTIPLLRLADEVEGIDASAEMLSIARAKGLRASQGTYDSLPPRRYDLISVGLAFHWFDRELAVRSLASASQEEAVWLIYNFAFAGHQSDARFNTWLSEWYGTAFPSPARARTDFVVTKYDAGLSLVKCGTGSMPLSMSREALIGYLTTQSNVEARLSPTRNYADIEAEIDQSLPPLGPGRFVYHYTYTIAKYSR